MSELEKRICPNCGAENYSADTLTDWNCWRCGAKIKRKVDGCDNHREKRKEGKTPCQNRKSV